MKSVKRILSLILSVALVLSVLPFAMSSGGPVASAALESDPSLVIKRPTANVSVTEVTRVAYSKYSMKQPSGSNSVIVKATPSGMPELAGHFNSLAYAGETPVATQISFTPGTTLASVPTISCSNTTVILSDYTYSNGTYSWYVTGGTATVGTTLIFTVSYVYTDTNPITGKSYTNTYSSHGVSYVEAIAIPAGEYSTKRTYEDFFFGQSNKNRSYIASYILGANTYGSLYANGEGEGSVYFESTDSVPGWTTEYGMMHRSDGHSAARDYNIGYDPDGNRPYSYIYFDRSIHSTLSDLNLRIVTSNIEEASNESERVSVFHKNTFVNYGVTDTFETEDASSDPPSNSMAAADLGLTNFTGSIYGVGASFMLYFTGSAPAVSNGSTDYTISLRYRTPAAWNEVFIGHSHSIRVISYDKGALRTLIEGIQGTDPSRMTTDIPAGGFKGYNPQSWYYSSGWESFYNVFNAAKACLNRPDTTQEEIDQKCAALQKAYDELEMRVADYSVANAYYNQALAKNPDYYTLASWAKVQNILDNYVTNISIIYQPAVDKMAADLKYALDTLQEATADYSVFNKHLSTINSLIRNSESIYGVPAEQAFNNWSTLITTLKRSGCVYDELDGYIVAEPLLISQQPTVDGYVLSIERAINALSLTSANYTEAGKAETAYKLLNLNNIVPEIVTELTAAYNALVDLHGKDLSYQSKVDEATANLNYWLERVQYKPADISAALTILGEAYSLDRSGYDNLTEVDTAVANLESKLNLDIRYQNEINRAVSALRTAIDNLDKSVADYSIVDEAIAVVTEHEALIKDTYADTYGFTADVFYSNWSAVVTAMNNVVRGLDYTQQETVDNYANAILLAFNARVESTADYTEVKLLQNEAYNIVTTCDTLYTAASLDNLTAANAAVVTNKPISQQATVDGYAQAIQDAIDSLEYLPADYTEFNKQLALAKNATDLDDAYALAHPGYTYYTADSMAELETAVANVTEGLDIRYQTQVDAYAKSIVTALSGLEYAPADYTQVDLKLTEIPSDLSVYTTLSVATLNASVNSIKRTYTADKQSTVDRYVTTIDNAIKNLKFKAGDYSAVNTALAKVPSDSSIYTEESWNYLQEQIDAVAYGLDISHQEEINNYALAIEQAVEFLRLKTADYTAVIEAVRIAREKIESGWYTDDSIAAVEEAVEAVEYDYPLERQAEVNAFAAAINDAISKLVPKAADYTAVRNAITVAEEKIATGRYTDESVALLEEAIDSVVYDLTAEYQDEVQQYADNIVNLTNELDLKLADYTELQNILDLLDNSSSWIYTNTYKNFNEVMSLIVSYRELTVSQNMALTIDNQAQVNEMAATLQGYLDMLEPDVTENFEAIGTTVFKTQKGVNYIYGLKEKLTTAQFERTYVSFENVTLEYELTTARWLGTGSVVRVISDSTNEVIAEYVIVIYGDVDGSAVVDSEDATLILDSINGVTSPLDGEYKLAANVAGTRANIDTDDKIALDDVIKGTLVIDQVSGKAA